MYVKTIVAYCLFAVSINYAMEKDDIVDIFLPFLISLIKEQKLESLVKKPQILHKIIIHSEFSLEEKLHIIKELIRHGVNVNEQAINDTHKLTPLHLAATCVGSEEIIIMLRKAGANPYLLNAYDQCPINDAVYTGNANNLKALLEKIPNNPQVIPTNINLQNKAGETFLHYVLNNAIKNGKNKTTNMINLLISHNADVNKREYYSNATPLHYAAGQENCAESILALAKAGANIYTPDIHNTLPIEISLFDNRKENTKVILDIYVNLLPSIK